LRAALPDWTIELLDGDDYPPEDGDTYYANARLKALYGRAVGPGDAWVLGEDSGIEVEALGAEPGVRSARWAESGRQHLHLLERLGDATDRYARMIAHMVAIGPDGREVDAVGVMEGEIAAEPRGTGGFGYDPVFVPDDGDGTRTMAELDDAEKDGISHRGRAARALLAWLDG
jgi:XTP/dITP diphosphohydrolase